MNLYFSYHKMVNVKYCKVQISNELSWFNHSSIIISQLVTMPTESKIRSINVSNKWKTWYIKSKSKISIVLSYCEFVFHIIRLFILSMILCYLGKILKDHLFLAPCPTEPHLTGRRYHFSLGKKNHLILTLHLNF